MDESEGLFVRAEDGIVEVDKGEDITVYRRG